MTNHFYEHDPLSAMYSAIHEGGHAIFEQNVNPDYDGTVAGSCSYMGIHESQSCFYENILEEIRISGFRFMQKCRKNATVSGRFVG